MESFEENFANSGFLRRLGRCITQKIPPNSRIINILAVMEYRKTFREKATVMEHRKTFREEATVMEHRKTFREKASEFPTILYF